MSRYRETHMPPGPRHSAGSSIRDRVKVTAALALIVAGIFVLGLIVGGAL